MKLGCHENAECIEINPESAEPEYGCQCKTGFDGDGSIACDDIDECDGAVYVCGQNGLCKNTDGSFECDCEKGYEDVTGVCVDIDECKDGGHVCDINAYCYDVPGWIKLFEHRSGHLNLTRPSSFHVLPQGSFGCGPCKSGYSKTCTECFIGMCSNIDECLDPNACSYLSESDCVDTPGLSSPL